MADLCPGVFTGPSNGSAAATSAPAPETEIRPGQRVEIRLTWRTADFAGDKLDRAAHCVTVDGGLSAPLSRIEVPAANDGEFAISFDAPAAGRICDRGFLRGEGWQEALVTERSDEICFNVVGGALPIGTPGVTGEDPLAGFASFCPVAAKNTAGAAPVEQWTSVADEAVVRPGDTVDLSLKWLTTDLAGDSLARVAACVRVESRFDPGLSAQEHPAPNDGWFTHRFTVPEGLAPGARICSRGYLAGRFPGREDARRLKSTETCFKTPLVALVRTANATPSQMAELPRTGFGPREFGLIGLATVGLGYSARRLARRRLPAAPR